MALTGLPNELLEIVISHALPEGFESLALTCKRIHALSTPFIERHNELRSEFRHWKYYERKEGLWNSIGSAYELITRIAVEPVVARYIRRADFQNDGRMLNRKPRWMMSDVDCKETVLDVFAASSHLKQAHLDWNEYYAKIEEDLNVATYSQRALAFLLTLLPNVEMIELPRCWMPLVDTAKLIETAFCTANPGRLSFYTPSLARVIKGQPGWDRTIKARCAFHWTTVTIDSPQMQSTPGRGHESIVLKEPRYCSGGALEALCLVDCDIDEVDIANLLKHTPGLRTFRYSHSTDVNGGIQCWDICKFIAAIEREAGTYLVNLSIRISELPGSITPGEASMRGFRCLETLEIPLELAFCHATTAKHQSTMLKESQSKDPTDQELEYREPFIGDLIPASVSLLSLVSDCTDGYVKILDVMFHQFTAKKDSQLPALKQIYLTCFSSANKDRFKRRQSIALGHLRLEIWAEQCASAERVISPPFLDLVENIAEPYVHVIDEELALKTL